MGFGKGSALGGVGIWKVDRTMDVGDARRLALMCTNKQYCMSRMHGSLRTNRTFHINFGATAESRFEK